MSPIFLFFSVLAAALPALAYLLFIWWLDRYEREPLKAVLGTFLFGATGGIFFALKGSEVLVGVVLALQIDIPIEVLVSLVEEPAKALILFLLLSGKNFDNTTDGLVYGAATGLGFAMTENFLYFFIPYSQGDLEGWKYLVMIRGTFTALMHCSASAVFGAMLGVFRYHGGVKERVVGPLLGFFFAALIHSAFNGLLVLSVTSGEELYGTVALGLIPVLGVVLTFVTQSALRHEHKLIKRELIEEVRIGTLPGAHAQVIPYYFKRRKADWLPPQIDRNEYAKTATLIAFRRHQAQLKGNSVGVDNKAIQDLRMELAQMQAQGGVLVRPGNF